MTTLREALRLADELADPDARLYAYQLAQAAAELRRQHGEIKSMLAERLRSERRLLDVKAQRNALLEALKGMRRKYGEYACSVCDHADAAIKAVEETK